METLEVIVLIIPCLFLASICLCRAAVMNSKAKLLPRVALAGLFMSSAAGVLSPILHWNTYWILIGLVISILALMYAARDNWVDGVPRAFLKDEWRWPNRERRDGTERRQPVERRQIS